MKKKIEIAISRKIVNSEVVEIDFPTVAKYYAYLDDGNFFPRGLVLFAIIPKFEGKISTYILIEVERSKQNYNDFVPTKDCKYEDWINSNSIRHRALDILRGKDYNFKNITEQEFEEQRLLLLDDYKKL